MKINNKSFLYITGSLLAIATTLTSCNNDEADLPDTSGQKALITATQTSYTVAEGDTIMMEFQVDKAINTVMDFEFVLNENSTVNFDDITVGDGAQLGDFGNPNTSYLYTVPEFSESFMVPVIANRDLTVGEGDEVISLNMSATGRRTGLTKDGGIDIQITVTDEITDEFVVTLDWSATYLDEDGAEHDFCDFDLDLEIYDSAGATVADSYSSCPEMISLNPGDLADGQYEIVASFYTGDGASMPVNFESIPASVTLAKRGVSNNVVDLSGIWTEFDEGLDPNADGVIDNPQYYETVANLEISGTTYTVTNPETGEVIFQGRGE